MQPENHTGTEVSPYFAREQGLQRDPCHAARKRCWCHTRARGQDFGASVQRDALLLGELPCHGQVHSHGRPRHTASTELHSRPTFTSLWNYTGGCSSQRETVAATVSPPTVPHFTWDASNISLYNSAYRLFCYGGTGPILLGLIVNKQIFIKTRALSSSIKMIYYVPFPFTHLYNEL